MSKGKYKRQKQQRQEHMREEAPHTPILDGKGNPESEAEASASRKKESNRNKEEHFLRFRQLINSNILTNWLLVFFTGALAVAAIYQFIIIGSQLDVMRKDQRPWLKLTFELNPIKAQSPITGVVHIVNGGKTPAKNIKGDLVIEKVENGEVPKLDYALPHTRATTGTIFPNDPPANVVVAMTRFGADGSSIENELLTQAQYDDFVSTRVFFVVYGKISYEDFFGIEHWTQGCEFFTPANAIGTATAQKCTNYGDVDRN